MAIRDSSAIWTGSLAEGKGSMRLGSGAYEGEFTRASRFENGPGTNPEELIGAAHAGCFSMFLAAILSDAGHVPTKIATSAKVHHHSILTELLHHVNNIILIIQPGSISFSDECGLCFF